MLENTGGSFKVSYYKASGGNVGDDLNLYIWKHFFGEYLRDNSETTFIGIGSVLDHRFDDARSKIVFGAGARSNNTVPDVADGTWDIRFVRGPNTANALGLPDEKYISDPAILAPLVYSNIDRRRVTKGKIGLIPYFCTNIEYAKRLGETAGLEVISVKQSPDLFIQKLLGCEFVYAEAMHRAILADAFRIPWKPIRISNKEHEKDTHDFKWKDWMGSLALSSEFLTLPNFYSDDSWRGSLKMKIKCIAGWLRIKSNKKDWNLSDEILFSRRKSQMLEAIECLKSDLS